jgi:hypothetical protein
MMATSPVEPHVVLVGPMATGTSSIGPAAGGTITDGQAREVPVAPVCFVAYRRR